MKAKPNRKEIYIGGGRVMIHDGKAFGKRSVFFTKSTQAEKRIPLGATITYETPAYVDPKNLLVALTFTTLESVDGVMEALTDMRAAMVADGVVEAPKVAP
jgi:hypothetical protein